MEWQILQVDAPQNASHVPAQHLNHAKRQRQHCQYRRPRYRYRRGRTTAALHSRLGARRTECKYSFDGRATALAVHLRFNATRSPALPLDVSGRLMRLVGRRMTVDGWLLIDARRFRSQAHSREDAPELLTDLIRKAAEKPARRKKTKPSLASSQHRLASKRCCGEVKQLRGEPGQEG
jgi:ribosome-associated protein